MAIEHITQDNYEELVLQSSKPVLLDFWAPWCGPCRMISPILEQIAAEHPDILIGKINVEEEETLAREFGLASIPLLVVMVDGAATVTAVGYQSKADIKKMLKL